MYMLCFPFLTAFLYIRIYSDQYILLHDHYAYVSIMFEHKRINFCSALSTGSVGFF